jgi:hypothetical protein
MGNRFWRNGKMIRAGAIINGGWMRATVQERKMLKMAAAGMTALLLTASPLAYAQTPSNAAGSNATQDQLSESDAKTLTDVRVELVKDALQLTPDQQKLWPPVEAAIRNRAKNRFTRLYDFAGRAQELRAHPLQTLLNRDPVEFMQRRADALEQRSRDLKQLASAWQPLFQTLSQDQRRRMALLTVSVLRELRNGPEERSPDFYGVDEP